MQCESIIYSETKYFTHSKLLLHANLDVNEESFDWPVWIVNSEMVIQHLHQQQLLRQDNVHGLLSIKLRHVGDKT